MSRIRENRRRRTILDSRLHGNDGRSVGAWWRTKRVMQGVVDLCDQPGGLGSVLGDGGGRFGKRPAVVVTGFGSRAWAGRDLLGAFAECSVGEDVGGGDAVVGGGLFVAVIGDVAQDLDELEAVVGHLEYGLGEVERGV